MQGLFCIYEKLWSVKLHRTRIVWKVCVLYKLLFETQVLDIVYNHIFKNMTLHRNPQSIYYQFITNLHWNLLLQKLEILTNSLRKIYILNKI